MILVLIFLDIVRTAFWRMCDMRWKTFKLLIPSIFLSIGVGGHWESCNIGFITFGACFYLGILLCEDK
jgi:hypothetical protein